MNGFFFTEIYKVHVSINNRQGQHICQSKRTLFDDLKVVSKSRPGQTGHIRERLVFQRKFRSGRDGCQVGAM